MEEIRDRRFAGEDLTIDGKSFIGCTFESGTIHYAGGALPTFEQCTFGAVQWHFDDAALRTVQLLQMIFNSPGGFDFIKSLFQHGQIFDG
jgi:hypothetical protein